MKNDLNDCHLLKRIQRELEKLSRLFNAQGKDVILSPQLWKQYSKPQVFWFRDLSTPYLTNKCLILTRGEHLRSLATRLFFFFLNREKSRQSNQKLHSAVETEYIISPALSSDNKTVTTSQLGESVSRFPPLYYRTQPVFNNKNSEMCKDNVLLQNLQYKKS